MAISQSKCDKLRALAEFCFGKNASVYQSEYDKYREEMRARHPDWEREQREGLGRLWDRNLDPAELRSYREASERKKAYPYDVNFQGSA
ncbi:MAG: DUF3460 family protein [Candidatus Accumulibacter sp.]|jgi:hypothetical protein|nr:DUF3460 family protein [Accumulibacter sp.]